MAARKASQLLDARGYRVPGGAPAAMASVGVTDPGQARCCLKALARETGADAVLLGSIESFGAVGASTRFWRAVSNMATVRFNDAEGGRRMSRRYLSAQVALELVRPGPPEVVLWRGESSRWTTAEPALGSEGDLYRDLGLAIEDALASLPARAGRP